MITKELLVEKFPQFKIHRANFVTGAFYLMVHKGLSFHLDVFGEGTAKVEAFAWSVKVTEKSLKQEELIEYINKLIIEHDTY